MWMQKGMLHIWSFETGGIGMYVPGGSKGYPKYCVFGEV